MASSEAPSAKVVSIFIYPVKSCRGISVSEAPLASTGKVPQLPFFFFFFLQLLIGYNINLCNQELKNFFAIFLLLLLVILRVVSWTSIYDLCQVSRLVWCAIILAFSVFLALDS